MKRFNVHWYYVLVWIISGLFIIGCDGSDGATGAAGPAGPEGPPGPPGPPADQTVLVGDGSALTPEQIEAFGKLQAEITGVTVTSPPVVEFTVLDASGNPALGLSAGTVRFTFAKLMPADTGSPPFNGGLPYWQSYLVELAPPDQASGPNVLAQATRNTTESGGTLEELGDGQYRYTFATDVTNVTQPIAVPWQPNLTHRVGMEIRLDSGSGARRPMAPFNPVLDFVPDGGAGTGVTKNIIDTDNCENCHFEFAFHGGQRKSVEYCVTCHNPGHIDTDSGNSLDMAHMVHSIHMGHDRVDDQGTSDPLDDVPIPYIIYRNFGGNDFTFDFSEVGFPRSKTYCEGCHTASATAPDGDNWNTNASAKTCGGCHASGLLATNYDPVTGQPDYFMDHAAAHADVPIGTVEDGQCPACHLGTISTAGPPLAIHSRIRSDDRARAEAGDNFVFDIMSATNTGPGETPIVTFRVTSPGGSPYNIFSSPQFTDPVAALNLYVAWSTDDYYGGDENGLVLGARKLDAVTIQEIQNLTLHDTAYPYRMFLDAIRDAIQNGGSINPDGSYTVPFFRALPVDMTGDVAIALGGHPAWQTTDADGLAYSERAAVVSDVFYPGEPRQAAFDSDNCNACHIRLIRHGANRNGNYEFCLLCHNGDAAVCDATPNPDGSCPAPETMEGFHFGRMIHSIHSGSETFLGGEFMHVEFPQNIANCETCHKPGLYNTARPTARAVSTDHGADIRVWTDDIATTANAAVCGVCHTSTAARGHFESMGGQVDDLKCSIVGAECGAPDGSSGTGLPNGQESCPVCHGTGAEFETSRFHNPGVE